jgi:hypothetical protein
LKALRLGAGLVLCLLVQGVAPWSWPLRPVLLPGYVILAGRTQKGETGAKVGLAGGILWTVLGVSPWKVLFLTLLGGISGEVFHRPLGFWGNWLASLPLLAGWEGAQILLHGGLGTWRALLLVAGWEWLACALGFPLAWLLWRGTAGRRERRLA